ncbi:MAG: DNA-binding protein [Gammaproteobacteria bacterium]|nr:DNA-binding protein [Gammaproteobacteria bacterium]
MNRVPLIKTETDYEAALERIEALWGAEPDTAEGDEFELLCVRVEAYEDLHYPIEPPDPIEAIKFTMEHKNLKRKDLEPYIGSRGRVSEVLNHKRDLSINMIRNLHKGLGIPLESLLGMGG